MVDPKFSISYSKEKKKEKTVKTSFGHFWVHVAKVWFGLVIGVAI